MFSPSLLPRIGSHAIFCDGSIKLSEALPVLGRGRVVRWLQHEAPIQKQNCIKIATLSQIPGLNVAILTQKLMSTKQRFAVRRTEERRVGKVCVSRCRSRCSPET